MGMFRCISNFSVDVLDISIIMETNIWVELAKLTAAFLDGGGLGANFGKTINIDFYAI